MTWTDDGRITFGSGDYIGKNTILDYTDTPHIPVETIQVSTYLVGIGSWEIVQTIGKWQYVVKIIYQLCLL